MKKYITTILITLIAVISAYAQPTAKIDTVRLTGTNTVALNLLSNDRGTIITLYYYTIQGIKYNPASYSRTISNFGRINLNNAGVGSFTPVESYSKGSVTYAIRDRRGRVSTSKIVFVQTPVVVVDTPDATPPSEFAYTWVSNIGNTSSIDHGANKLKGLRAPTSVTELNGYLYVTTGFTEGNGPAFKTPINNLKVKYEIGRSANGYDKMLEGTWGVSDGTNFYMVGFDPYGYTANGGTGYTSKIDCAIVGYDINDNLINFSAGTSFSNSLQDIPYSSGIVVTRNDSTQKPIRLAVDNTFLYVYTKDSIKTFSKSTGARISAVHYTPTPGVISTFTKGSTTLTMTASSVTYNGSVLATAFNGPAVNNYKYVPRDFNFHKYLGCVYIGSDNTFWVVDAGNSRILHYTSSGVYINQLAYVPMNYNCSVDRNDPTRVFAGFLEYKVTYPALTWELVNNWSYGIDSRYRPRGSYENAVGVLRNVVTTASGTFGIVDSVILYEGYSIAYPAKVKLTPSGLVRTKVYDAYENVWFDTNGDEYIAVCGNELGSRNTLYKNGVQIEQSPIITDSSASYLDDGGFAYTSDGHYLVFNNMNNAKANYHLEWIKNGVVVKKAAKSIAGVQSSYPTTDRFMVDGVGGLPSSKKIAIVDSIAVFMYSGEGYQNAQTTKLHIYKNKQFYRIIGKTYAEAVSASGTSDTPKEFAGNAFAGDLVKVDGKYYYFYNDEHGGSLQCFVISIP